MGLEQVQLVTMEGVDSEGCRSRYAFVDECFAVNAELQAIAAGDSLFKRLTNDELARFQQALKRKHGKPRGEMDLFGFADRKPNIFIWDKQGNVMVFTKKSVRGSQLILHNKVLAKKVEAYKKSECKLHRFDPDKPTPVTEQCL